MNSNRIIWVDWAKSLCMLLVVFGHCHFQDSFISDIIYSFHIPLFFFLSGLLCSKNTTRNSIIKDFKYLILPYLFYGSIYVLFTSILSHNINGQYLKAELIKLFIGIDCSIGAIWFLPALFICKQFYYLTNITRKYSYIFHIIAIASLFPPYFIYQYDLNIPLFCDSAIFGLPFFIWGNISYTYINNQIHIICFQKSFILSIILLVVTVFLSIYNGFVCIAECQYGNSFLIYYLNAATGIFAIIYFCIGMKKSNKFIITTSYGTIVTLGLHNYFFLFFNYYLPKLLEINLMTYPLYLGVLYTIIIYTCCYYLIIILDKYMPKPFGLKGKLKEVLNNIK